MSDKTIIGGALALIVVVGAILYVVSGNSPSTTAPTTSSSTVESGVASGPNVALAQCLKDSGAVFYGAFWCPHCKKQKEEFGAAVPALPYIECSTPDGNDQTPICKAKGIKSYPTWKFADGSEMTGEVALDKLAEKTNCTQALPGAASASTSTNAITSSSSAVLN